MTRPISTKMHGAIDYSWAATAAALPSRMEDAPVTSGLVRGAGFAATISSMMTNYEAGVIRVLPMKGHLALDVAMCGLLLASPWFLPRSERRYVGAPIALGLSGLMAALLTETESPLEHNVPARAALPQLGPGLAESEMGHSPGSHLE